MGNTRNKLRLSIQTLTLDVQQQRQQLSDLKMEKTNFERRLTLEEKKSDLTRKQKAHAQKELKRAQTLKQADEVVAYKIRDKVIILLDKRNVLKMDIKRLKEKKAVAEQEIAALDEPDPKKRAVLKQAIFPMLTRMHDFSSKTKHIEVENMLRAKLVFEWV